MVLLGGKRPSSNKRDKGFSSRCWMARLSGRAPNTGSKPTLANSDKAAALTSKLRSMRAKRSRKACSWMLAIDAMCWASSPWKTTVSSMRLRNSGRKCCLTSTQTAALEVADLQAIKSDSLNALQTSSVAALSTTQIAGLTNNQVAALKTAHVAALGTDQVAAITTAQTAYLTTAQMAALTTSQIAALTSTQAKGLSESQIGALTTSQAQAMTPADLAKHVDIIVSVVVNADQTEQVLFGENGAAANLKAGSLFIMCSTVDPNWSVALEKRLNDIGLLYLDAPISGGAAKAASGQMTMMTSGQTAAYAKAGNALESMAANVYKLGDRAGDRKSVV